MSVICSGIKYVTTRSIHLLERDYLLKDVPYYSLRISPILHLIRYAQDIPCLSHEVLEIFIRALVS